MDLSVLFKRAGKVAADNSPAILTAIGVSGTITTAVLAAKAAYNSVDILSSAIANKRAFDENGEPREDKSPRDMTPEEIAERELTTQEKVGLVWKLYIPAAISAGMTITAIICANRLSDKRAAAMATAYTVVERSYKDYRDKVDQKLTDKKKVEVKEELAQEKVDRNPTSSTTFILTNNKGGTLCFDEWSGRYFMSDMESLRKAVNDFNAELINSTYSPLTEFYHLIGLPSTRESDEVGWDTDKLLDVDFTTVLSENGEPALVIEFKNPPNTRYSTLY